MSETVIRTDQFEIKIAKGHSVYFAELDEKGKPVKAVYIDWKDLVKVGF